MAPELKQQSALLQPQDHLEFFIKHFCYFHMLDVENTANYCEKMQINFICAAARLLLRYSRHRFVQTSSHANCLGACSYCGLTVAERAAPND